MKSNTMKLYKYLKRYHTGMEKAIIAKHIRRTKTFHKKDILPTATKKRLPHGCFTGIRGAFICAKLQAVTYL